MLVVNIAARKTLRASSEPLCAIVMIRIPEIIKGLTYLRILRNSRLLFSFRGQLYGADIADCKSKFSIEK